MLPLMFNVIVITYVADQCFLQQFRKNRLSKPVVPNRSATVSGAVNFEILPFIDILPQNMQ
jgi:hypothetical protein